MPKVNHSGTHTNPMAMESIYKYTCLYIANETAKLMMLFIAVFFSAKQSFISQGYHASILLIFLEVATLRTNI